MFTATFQGSVFDTQGTLLFPDVNGEITEKTRPLDKTIERKGWLTIANGVNPVPVSGQQFELRLDDGRKAPMRVMRVDSGSSIDTTVHFDVLAPLQ